MAINEDVPGIQVTVQIHGTDAVEYAAADAANEESACPTVTKYIECIDDASFGVRVLVDGNYEWGYKDHSLVYYLHIDGKFVRGLVVGYNKLAVSNTGALEFEAMFKDRHEFDGVFGQWVRRKYKFATVKTVDDVQNERLEQERKIARSLGLIEVKVARGIDHGIEPAPAHAADDSFSSFELAEKSLKGKAISHGTSYGTAQAINAPTYHSVLTLPEDNGPIAIFRFLYRSREALKRELIIPRTPPPRSPTLTAMSEAERDRLARERLKQLNLKKGGEHSIKREFGEVYDLTQDDAPLRPGKIAKQNPGEKAVLIDLTEDD